VTNEAGVIGAAAAGSHAETCRRTVLADVSFTAPFKAISPFYRGDGHMRVMLISVSAGLMCGDEQEIGIDVQDGAWLDVTSQAFEKVHKMPDGSFARRHTRLSVGKGATLNYTPLPAIPFRDSAFKSETEVRLADHTSRFFQSEIISCGRASRGERFEYRAFESRTKIYAGPTLVYADNAAYIPGKAQMEGFCIFEGYTHFASYIMVHQNISEERAEELGEAVRSLNGGAGGLTRTGYGDYCARALSNGSEQLIGLGAELRRILGLGI
jgi:urease accessory protein